MKSIFKSKTFWFNVLTAAGSIITLVGGVLPPKDMQYIVALTSLVNIGLRMVTKDAVSLTGETK